MGKVNLIRKITTIAPLVYTAVNNPAIRGALITTLGRASAKLTRLENDRKNIMVGEVVGEVENESNGGKNSHKIIEKIPDGALSIINGGILKVRGLLLNMNGSRGR